MEVDKDRQALSPWLCIVRLVDPYGDLVAIWSWDGLVHDALYWNLRLEVPALHHTSVSYACYVMCLQHLAVSSSNREIHGCIAGACGKLSVLFAAEQMLTQRDLVCVMHSLEESFV